MFSPIILDQKDQLENIIASSLNPQIKGVFVFKHSTRCGVSRMVLNELKRDWDLNDDVEFWILDLLKFREISNHIADRFRVVHESPQLLYISDGLPKQNASHYEANMETVHRWLND
jgi:bacillithiol system protein YtxJ